jgi:hypothetical protein
MGFNPIGLILVALGGLLIFWAVKGGSSAKPSSSSSSGSTGAGTIGPNGQVIGTPGQTTSLSPGESYTPGMPSYPNYPSYGNGGGSTVIVPSSLRGAGSTGGQGLG